jgi:4-hydroxy-4-methyl-2-oxoglutarate aldolase
MIEMGASASVPPSAAVADVLALRGRTGWLSPPLGCVVAGVGDGAVAGAACTVELRRGRGGFGPLYELLSGDLTRRVLLLSVPDDEAAVWGGLLATAAAGAGAEAVLVAGAVRDLAACRKLGVPMWARATRTVGPAGALEVAAIGSPVDVGGVAVADGDLVVVDGDGVVALPAAAVEADAVLADARAYAEAEEAVAAALLAGTPLRDAYRLKAEAVARLTRP